MKLFYSEIIQLLIENKSVLHNELYYSLWKENMRTFLFMLGKDVLFIFK